MIRSLTTDHAELEIRVVGIEAALQRLRAETAAAMEHSVNNTKRIAAAMDAEIATLLADVEDLLGAEPVRQAAE